MMVPFRFEGIPNAPLKFIPCTVPAIDTGGCQEFEQQAAHQWPGLEAPFDNADALAGVVVALARNFSLRDTMAPRPTRQAKDFPLEPLFP